MAKKNSLREAGPQGRGKSSRYPSSEEVARLFRIPARRVRELKALAAKLSEAAKPAE